MTTDPLAILQTAAFLAAKAHAGQFIRSSDIPYIAHPIGVSLAVTSLFGCPDPEVAAAALLHDTLEKTSLGADEIKEKLGGRVLHLVVALTKRKDTGKAEYWQQLNADVWEARIIKMADALDHLDCPAAELARRIGSGQRAVELAWSDEEPVRNARRILDEALVTAAIRLGALTASS